MRLADYIRANDPQLAGNATLVIRTQSYPNSQAINGSDLYTDRGEYFYAPSERGLPRRSPPTTTWGTVCSHVRWQQLSRVLSREFVGSGSAG